MSLLEQSLAIALRQQVQRPAVGYRPAVERGHKKSKRPEYTEQQLMWPRLETPSQEAFQPSAQVQAPLDQWFYAERSEGGNVEHISMRDRCTVGGFINGSPEALDIIQEFGEEATDETVEYTDELAVDLE